MQDVEVVLIVMTLMIFSGIGVLYMAMSNRRAWREMEHRERLAMIQRGIVPAPETDPLEFEAAVLPYQRSSARSERWRSAGIITIGFGFALMMLLTFTAGEPAVGIGVGGAFAVLGATLLFIRGGRTEVYRQYPVGPARRTAQAPGTQPPGTQQPPGL